MIVSGKTGEVLQAVGTPDQKESYYSPQILTYPDGTDYVLFGTGGEVCYLYLLSFIRPRLFCKCDTHMHCITYISKLIFFLLETTKTHGGGLYLLSLAELYKGSTENVSFCSIINTLS